MQNFFDKLEATKMLLYILSDPKHSQIDDDLFNEFLCFGISLLDGGNKTVQKTIYNYVTLFQKSEVMFAKFYSIIYEQIAFLKRKDEKNAKKEDPEATEREELKSSILENLLRFMQLFTEGHNLDLQNYLRFQTNSRNRYDMVEAVIELLRTYYSNLVQGNYDNIIKCLDTLTEFVQGPCPENQLVLIDGKFFEVASGILSKEIKKPKNKEDENEDEEKTSKKQKKKTQKLEKDKKNEELEPWMLARLKYKILILVNSLLEMRKSDAVVKRIMRSLPLDILKKNLIKIFKRYRKQYGKNYTMDVLKHVNRI